MVFSSLIFIFLFLPAFIFFYYLTPRKYRNIAALVGSLFFYAWGAPCFVFILVGTSLIDYLVSLLISKKAVGSQQRKTWLIMALVYNLLLLGYFKYANFFIDQANWLFNLGHLSEISWQKIILPIGISFFTFHKISYLVDVYRGTVKPARNFVNFLLYITLFPQLIAGPIVRYHDIADQIINREHSFEKFFYGIYRFSLGLGKKVLIANVLGRVADNVFGLDFNSLTFSYAWLGALAYALQIYFDFSGYSDMAIGLAKMMGFDFLENFNFPYISQNFTEFWRRWHISLSRFMREYVYIPLGGNKLGQYQTSINLFIVFLLSGFWHGANWTFLFWGVYQGLFIVMDKMFWLKISEKIPKIINIVITFVLMLFGWVLFRSENFGSALLYIGKMLNFGYLSASHVLWPEIIDNRGLVILILALFLSFMPAFSVIEKTYSFEPAKKFGTAFWQLVTILVLTFFSVLSLVNSGFNPFIYFRF